LPTRAAKDDFAAQICLNLLRPPEQNIRKAQTAADREIAACRTPDALGHLVMVSVAKADDTSLALRVAELQAWFGQDKELADIAGEPWKLPGHIRFQGVESLCQGLLLAPHEGHNPARGCLSGLLGGDQTSTLHKIALLRTTPILST
jgi:hypothetical protein